MVHLTDLQRKVMDFILGRIAASGVPPTLREISGHFGWKAVGSAQDVVAALRKKGVLMPAMPGKARQLVPSPDMLRQAHAKGPLPEEKPKGKPKLTTGLELTSDRLENSPTMNLVPVLGLVQAGNPAEAIENAGEYIPFLRCHNRAGEGGGSYFAVVVEGYSMMNVGFLPGDYLLVESCQNAKNGDIVLAALRDHEVTVKRFAMRGSLLYRQSYEKMEKHKFSLDRMPPALLVPENPDFEPIPFGLEEMDRLVGLVRSLYRKDVV